MALRSPPRWRTRFGRWLDGYTVPRVARALEHAGCPVTSGAVYSWLSGRSAPNLKQAGVLLRLARGGLNLGDIVRQRQRVLQAQELGPRAGVASHSPQGAGRE